MPSLYYAIPVILRMNTIGFISSYFHCIHDIINHCQMIDDIHVKNVEIKSDGRISHFMIIWSETWFFTVLIKTAVHRAEYSALCGRHQKSRKIPIIIFP